MPPNPGFKVIELNGVTSEATHICDPDISLFKACSVLFEQWRIAFENGQKNRDLGHPPATVRELLALFKAYRAISRTHGPSGTDRSTPPRRTR